MVCFCPFYDMLKKEQPVFQGCPFILSNPSIKSYIAFHLLPTVPVGSLALPLQPYPLVAQDIRPPITARRTIISTTIFAIFSMFVD